MITARKLSANRANARASTGPKTRAGRARSAQNARRHGLSLPVLLDPTWSRDLDGLAQTIAGEDASEERRELARRIAAAQIDVIRVQRARHDLIARALADDDWDTAARAKVKTFIAGHLEKFPGSLIVHVLGMMKKPAGPDKLAAIISELSDKLMRLQRYERRALSRRKFAIRDFDAAIACLSVKKKNAH